jgi:peptidoglycan/LPS O-acetylase OafA/YrhL
MPKNRQLDLDVVRGVAILLAMGWHFNAVTGFLPLDILLWPGHTFGWAGVDLFFVLSGFLVGRILLKERVKTGTFDRWRFMKRRALKLWPVLYVYLVAELLMGDNPWQTFFFQNLVHLQNYLGTSLSQLWSLAVEEHFYLIVAVLYPIFVRRGSKPATMLIVLGSVMVASLAFRFGGTALGVPSVEIQWQTHFRADALAAGVFLAVLSVHYETAFAKMLTFRWLWFFLTVAGILAIVFIPHPGMWADTFGYTISYLTGASFLLLLHKAAWVPRASGVLRPIGQLGVYSYGLYIWHAAAAGVVVLLLSKVSAAAPGLALLSSTTAVVVLLKYAGAILVGVVMTVAVEWPALRIRDRFFPSVVHAVDDTRRETSPQRDEVPSGGRHRA